MHQPVVTLSADEATDLILKGEAPAYLRVPETIELTWKKDLSQLPAGLQVDGELWLQDSPIKGLPSGLTCFELYADRTPLKYLPDDLRVMNKIILNECTSLEALPAGLETGRLDLRGCHALSALPEDLDIFFLDIAGCTRLNSYPERGPSILGSFNMQGCTRLPGLPPWLQIVARLTISDCPAITQLPAALQVRTWADIANTGLSSLPDALKGVQLRWHGVPITERIAFAPETITVDEIIDERNVELRRVLLERMGYQTFLARSQAEIMDEDEDPGGRRQLLRMALPEDEDLVVLSVKDPSTARAYVLRVPPSMQNCHQAAAWIAGFENPGDYRPRIET
jgi:hypothetical protein